MQCPVCGAAHEDALEACPVCGAGLPPFAPGAVVADRYEIRAHLGRGGMGSVYRAFDRVLDEEVALKIQLAGAQRSAEAVRRFRAEVKLARQVSHPNVCRLHDGAQQEALRWISMELVDGETFADRVREGPVEGNEAWDLALQAAEGLAAVHRAGIVHRDLKALNLMVDRSGRVRLMDFGIAKPAAAGETGAGGYAQGSPEYMSPEQARGRPADARSDVYSMGVVLFELFTGRVPFRAETPVATLLQHLESTPPLDRLPEPLRPIVGRALAKDPELRFADGGSLAAALRATREGRHPTPSRPLGARRRRALAVAVAVLGAAAVSVVVLRTRPAPLATPSEPTQTPSATPLASPRPADEPSASGSASPEALPAPSRPTPAPTSPRGTSKPEPLDPKVAPTEEEPPPSPVATPPPTPEAPPAAATPLPSPSPPTAEPTPAVDGALLVVVRPWADVSVDGIPRGQTPLGRIPLPPGSHRVLLTHPDYRPYPRRVTIRPGETLRLVVDLRTDGVRRR